MTRVGGWVLLCTKYEEKVTLSDQFFLKQIIVHEVGLDALASLFCFNSSWCVMIWWHYFGESSKTTCRSSFFQPPKTNRTKKPHYNNIIVCALYMFVSICFTLNRMLNSMYKQAVQVHLTIANLIIYVLNIILTVDLTLMEFNFKSRLAFYTF